MREESYSRRVRRTSLLYVTLGFLVIGVIMSLVSIAPLYKPLRDGSIHNLTVVLRYAQQTVREYATGLLESTAGFSTRTDLMAALIAHNQGSMDRTGVESILLPEMDALLYDSGGIEGVLRLDLNGQPLAQAGVDIPPEYWQIPPETNLSPSLSVPFASGSHMLLVVASPVVDGHGFRFGTDLFLVNLDGLQERMRTFTGAGDFAQLVVGLPTTQGTSLLALTPSGDSLTLLDDRALRDAIQKASLQRREGVDWPDTSLRSAPVIAYTPIEGTDWAVAIHVPQNELFASVTSWLLRMLGVLALLMALGGVGMSFVLRPLADRLLVEADEMQRQVAEKTVALQTELSVRKQVETELERLRYQNLMILESAGEGILGLDMDMCLTFVNQAAARMLGYLPDELLHCGAHRLWHPERPDEDPCDPQTCIFAAALRGCEVRSGDDDVLWRSDGSCFPVEFTLTPMLEQGLVVGAVMTFRDISERQRAERTLRLSEEKFSKAFQTSPSLMSISTLEEGRYIDVNLAFEAATGYSREQLVGHSADELHIYLYNGVDRSALMRRLLEQGHLKNVEMRLQPRTGESLVTLMGAEIVEFEGQLCLLSVMNDVTERHERLREREAIAAMASALRATETRAEIVLVVLEQALSLMHAHGAALVMLAGEPQSLWVEGSAGSWSQMAHCTISDPDTPCHTVMRTGKPYLNNDLLQSPCGVPPEIATGLTGLAAVPLNSQHTSLGVLMVGRKTAFAEGELSVLAAIADIAANSIQRATLHEATERRLQRLAALHNIDLAINAGLELPLVQSILLAQACAQLGNDAARLLILSPGAHSLRPLAHQGFRLPPIGRLEIPMEGSYAGKVARERSLVYIPNLQQVDGMAVSEALPAGEDFITYHGVPLVAKGEVKGVLEIFHRSPYQSNAEWLEFLDNLSDQAAIAVDNAEMYANLQRSNFELEMAYDATLESLARALELRDRETEGHSRRVADLTERMVRCFGFTEKEIVHIRRGAMLHDIGKISIPDHILSKTGPLTNDEWQVMKLHPQYAAQLLEPIPFLRSTITIPYCHHERWDGSGYPRGLSGENIPLAARIFSVVDVWDALNSDRPYRKAWPREKVIEYIGEQSGQLFDPQVVEVFLKQIAGYHIFPGLPDAGPPPQPPYTPGVTTKLGG